MTIIHKPLWDAPAASIRLVGKTVIGAAGAIVRTMANRRAARRLSEMPDYLLTDLGLRRDDVSEALHADWHQDPTYRLAMTAARRRRGLCD
ncbi:DUF1127 domain-containing protein [Aurantimonas sp. HBX-1]|uniref:DUF1127 domain-containing protein n=1 Tax=Aurantimonas sp. HBX-1 TaxID=2906072 RepID=UPI001F24A95C|nr:DUF1127 domain-containing protein [Aurantimonas sp. HBX-1]UIJ71301.1 DUF1127 domain-containing protein [Aurantimonas sp. HBX-1]